MLNLHLEVFCFDSNEIITVEMPGNRSQVNPAKNRSWKNQMSKLRLKLINLQPAGLNPCSDDLL